MRAKKGKTTAGHCGDICATDPTGQPFINAVTIEAICGRFGLYMKIGNNVEIISI